MYYSDLLNVIRFLLFISQKERIKIEFWCEIYNNICHILSMHPE
jgi:hypothetical protein